MKESICKINDNEGNMLGFIKVESYLYIIDRYLSVVIGNI